MVKQVLTVYVIAAIDTGPLTSLSVFPLSELQRGYRTLLSDGYIALTLETPFLNVTQMSCYHRNACLQTCTTVRAAVLGN